MLAPSTELYLAEVEKFAGRNLQHRNEIGALIELANEQSLRQEFEELIFLAKFASNAASILKRVGTESDDTVKLSSEFSESLRRIVLHLRRITATASSDFGNRFGVFLDQSHEGLSRLMSLLSDLAWVKNYSLDRKRTPFSSSPGA